VSNAIKYNRAGGEVRVALAALPHGVALAIADDGQGLSADQVAGLFQPFNRAGAESSGIAGVGLGLAIAGQLVTAMHGRIEVRSTPAQGSVFTLTLPAAQGGVLSVPTHCATHCATQGAPAVPLRVVYVEDNPVNATVMAALMEERPNVTLAVAADGASGLALTRAEPPDLVLLDMHLPDMDGIEFFTRLRRDPRIADVPCVAVSANAMSQDVQAAIRAGMHGYLTKPIDVVKLFALIDHTPPR
jgi:CheY-like chemotaxis protein